jgi:glycosyltransferase involved in cell wall biosynthesis
LAIKLNNHAIIFIDSDVYLQWSRICGSTSAVYIGTNLSFEELVIVDDASTDQTYALLQQLATADARIKLFQNPTNIGYNANFEKAIRYSSGAYIAFADQDDIWEKEKLALMMNALQPSTALIYCDSVRFSDAIPTHPHPIKKIEELLGRSFVVGHV